MAMFNKIFFMAYLLPDELCDDELLELECDEELDECDEVELDGE